MAGTFFDRWLSMSGWMNDSKKSTTKDEATDKRTAAPSSPVDNQASKRIKTEDNSSLLATAVAAVRSSSDLSVSSDNPAGQITSQAELEKLIRAIATNPNLAPQQKNTTIQGLRDSVWKSNQMQKVRSEAQLATRNNNNSNVAAVARSYAPR